MKKILSLLFLIFVFSLMGCGESESTKLRKKIEQLKKDFSVYQGKFQKTQVDISQTEQKLVDSKKEYTELHQKNRELEKQSKQADEQLAYVEEKSKFLENLVLFREKETDHQSCIAKRMTLAAQVEMSRAVCVGHIARHAYCISKGRRRALFGLALGLGAAFFTGGASLAWAAGGAAAGKVTSKNCHQKPTCLESFPQTERALMSRAPVCTSPGIRPNIDGKMLVSPYAFPVDTSPQPLLDSDKATLEQLLQERHTDPQELARILQGSHPSASFLRGLSSAQLRILRNLPFALGGATFQDPVLHSFFSKQYWYKPQRSPGEVSIHDHIQKNVQRFWHFQRRKRYQKKRYKRKRKKKRRRYRLASRKRKKRKKYKRPRKKGRKKRRKRGRR